MSPVDPQTLSKAAAVHAKAHLGELIDEDRSCPGCGYSLKGLRNGGRCPECGRAITATSRFKKGILDHALTDAPMGYLRLVAAGGILMMVGSLATLFFLRFGWVNQNQWLAIAAGVASIAWLAGVYILTDPRRSDAIDPAEARREWRRTRWIVRGLFVAWLAAAIAVFIGIRLQFAGAAAMRAGLGSGAAAYVKYADAAALIAVFIGVTAFIPFCIMLVSFAEWARAYAMAERLRSAVWGLCAGGVIAIACHAIIGAMGPNNPIKFVFVIARTLGAIGFLIGLGLFLFSTVQLAFVSLWAIRNAHEHGEVEQRRAERKARELERDLATAPPPGVQPSAVFESREPTPVPSKYGPPKVRQGLQRERPTDLDAYDLAPDDEPT